VLTEKRNGHPPKPKPARRRPRVNSRFDRRVVPESVFDFVREAQRGVPLPLML